jgi:hypothetical protein
MTALPLPLAPQLLLAATDGGGMGGILMGGILRLISLCKKRRAQRVPAEKPSKFRHNELWFSMILLDNEKY